ncbi:MAG: penicillin-binding protein 1A [Myxococcota bacterium]|jgi:penicillin-binding protein 1A
MTGDRVSRWLLRGVGMAAIASALAASSGCFLYERHIVDEPGQHLDREAIRGIIAQESPVFYRDGATRVGVFFEAEHRHYVSFEELPTAYVVGLIAAEDGDFWTHPGFNVRGIARAMRDNLSAGRVVAGGSTITQQTAKNLYYRPDRTFRSKGFELLNAMRLEARYSKQEILEFYANQFHVTGNGRGIGIAARHFFDKEAQDLTLAESAFIAGLVKAPSRYDPFLGDSERRAAAVEASRGRTAYVLGRIADEDPSALAGPSPSDQEFLEIRGVQAEARRLLEEGFELEFRRGAFRYDASAVLDEVARRLSEPPFDQVLADAGIDDPATAGIQVVTTLDAPTQHAATYSLWHHLTEVGAWLEKPEVGDFVLKGHRGPRFDPDRAAIAGDFRVACVSEQVEVERKHLRVDLGGTPCTLDRDALVRAAVAVERGKRGDKYAKLPGAQVDAFVDALPVGSVVWVSVRSAEEPGDAVCDLELRPELQGSTVVMEGGAIRAMVGGNDNRNFNRATALRQFGSTWKPVVFHAAMQLGWTPDEALDNSRNVFPFSTTFYYPRPDHDPAPEVSMAWAGVNSENLASVWLLYHLTDRLDGEQIRELAASLGLARRDDETEEDYRRRIQLAGVLPTPSRVEEALFLQARGEALANIDGSTHPGDRRALASLLHGWGFDAERARVRRLGPSSRAWKERALDNSWRTLEPMLPLCEAQHAALEEAWSERRLPSGDSVADLTLLRDGERVLVACGTAPAGYVSPFEVLPEVYVTVQMEAPPMEVARSRRGPRRRVDVADSPAVVGGTNLSPIGDMLMDDRLHHESLRKLADGLERRRLAHTLRDSTPDLYAPEFLFWHQDFRVLLSLRYVARLAEQYGVQTDVREVLSMPLGASEITLEESVSLYGGLVSGERWSFPGDGPGGPVPSPPTPSLLIAELRDIDGNLLYRARPEAVRVAKPTVAAMTADILHGVVRWGTGRRASGAIQLEGGAVPIGGKTGTTNDFKNAAFLGYAPVAGDDGAFDPPGFVVGVYVGYDDNRPMTNGRIRLAGASGALPAWIGTVHGLADAGHLGAPAGDLVQGWWPSSRSPVLLRVPVEPGTGLRNADLAFDAAAPSVLMPRARLLEPGVHFSPIDRPARVAPRTDDPDARSRRLREWIWGRPRRTSEDEGN